MKPKRLLLLENMLLPQALKNYNTAKPYERQYWANRIDEHKTEIKEWYQSLKENVEVRRE